PDEPPTDTRERFAGADYTGTGAAPACPTDELPTALQNEAAAAGDDAEAGPGDAPGRRPLAAESRPAGRVTVRIDEAEDAPPGSGGPRPEGHRGGAPAMAADAHGDDGRAGTRLAADSVHVTQAALAGGPPGGARVVAAESRPSGEVSARVGDGDDGRAEGEAAATDPRPGNVT
ncbi:hypothetical protein JBF12_46690, partial [Streptomyces javensis]|nr:hypothetical protein [Streptomyces javensis]